MSGLTNNEIKIITGMLSDQKKEIMEEVNESLKGFKTSLSSIEGSVKMLAELAATAKGLAEKTYYSIEGNGAIGLKTQVKQNHEAIKQILEKLSIAEKETLLERIKAAECSEELKEKKYTRRAEDKRARMKNIFTIAGIGLIVLGDILIKILMTGGTP